MYTLGKMDTDTFMNLNRKLWDQLDRNIWPEELDQIKPSKWESMDTNLKGKAVLENLGKIIYYVTVLTTESEQARKQELKLRHEKSNDKLELDADNVPYSSHLYP